MAKRLEHTVRDEDLACRFAGDEFVLFVNPVLDKNQLVQLASRVISSIQQPISYQGALLSVGASIGITLAEYGEEKNVDALLKQSDQAMYEAKLSGKGKYIFYNMWQIIYIFLKNLFTLFLLMLY